MAASESIRKESADTFLEAVTSQEFLNPVLIQNIMDTQDDGKVKEMAQRQEIFQIGESSY